MFPTESLVLDILTFLSKILKNSLKLVGQIVSQIRPLTPAHKQFGAYGPVFSEQQFSFARHSKNFCGFALTISLVIMVYHFKASHNVAVLSKQLNIFVMSITSFFDQLSGFQNSNGDYSIGGSIQDRSGPQKCFQLVVPLAQIYTIYHFCGN